MEKADDLPILEWVMLDDELALELSLAKADSDVFDDAHDSEDYDDYGDEVHVALHQTPLIRLTYLSPRRVKNIARLLQAKEDASL